MMLGLLLSCSILSGCSDKEENKQNTQSTASAENQTGDSDATKTQEAFDAFTTDLFVHEVQSDSITLNYTLEKPEAYGIKKFEPTMGEYGTDAFQEDIVTCENVVKQLKSFDYDALTKDQQLTYDILMDSYQVTADDKKFLLYNESLGCTTGIQAELPILLSEYNISDKEDIKDYIKLLTTVDDYFEQIAEFEEEKSNAGLFMSDHNADRIISQCRDFIKTPEKNLLITIFNDRIDQMKWLSDAEKKQFKKQNKKAVLQDVIPAYEELIDDISDLKGTGTNEGGIGNLPEGQDYYEYLAQSITGSDMTVAQMKKALNKTKNSALGSISALSMMDDSLYDDFVDMKFSMTDPDEIVPYLEDAVKKDFPALEPVKYTVKYVDPSLEEYVSPAFYLTPQLDNWKENSIYINGAPDNDLSMIFSTLAHEGYPGHLLQCVYFNQQNPTPIRCLLNYGGYSEGWATYCEMLSYDYAGLKDNLSEFARQYNIFNLCLYAEMDIGVNYDCWSKKELGDYLADYGIDDDSVVDEVFDIVIDSPANYLQYTIGYIEFMNLKTEAQEQLEDDFQTKAFHTFLLDMGPSSFPIIADRMEDWIAEQKQ